MNQGSIKIMKDNIDHIKVLVADDEALARKRVVKFLAHSTYTFKITEATSGKETIHAILTEKPNIVFLDVKMTDMTGFDVLDAIPKQDIPIIIFVTAFDVFAIKAFELRAIDFLLKPYKEERFIEALERGVELLELKRHKSFQQNISEFMAYIKSEQNETKPEGSYIDQLALKVNRKYYFVKTKEIIYIKSSGYYAEIFTLNNKKHLHRISLTDLVSRLNPDQFQRINRSTIICIEQIQEIVSEGMGDFSVIMKDKVSFAVTKNYKAAFLKKMGIK